MSSTSDLTQAHIAEVLRSWVLDPDYPCLGARAVFNRDRAHIVTTGVLGKETSSLDVFAALRDFAGSVDPDEGLASMVAVFEGKAPASERAFETALWRTLQHLHDFDDEPWNPEVSSDPDSPEFSFSVAGMAFFVVGLHPAASRMARRAPWPILVFNQHAQFEELKASGRYGHMRDIIRARDLDLQGSINPMAADHGSSSEARQYSGRAVDLDWQAPLVTETSEEM